MELGEFQACEEQKGNARDYKGRNVRTINQWLRISLEQAQRRRFLLSFLSNFSFNF